MPKPLVGHHLLRVRIRKNIFGRLQDIAKAESERTNDYVTVSDLVRQACMTQINMYEQLSKLSHLPPSRSGAHSENVFSGDLDDDDDDDGDDDFVDEEDDGNPFSVHTLKG